jgi:hypothetical protein
MVRIITDLPSFVCVHRNTNKFDLNIYIKPTYADMAIKFLSNHPHDHKLTYYINRMLTLPITKQAETQ